MRRKDAIKRLGCGILSAILFLPFCGKAQSCSPFYFMDIALQRNWYNPAFIQPYEFSAGIPVLGGIHAQLDNNFLAWNSVVVRDAKDSLHIDVPRLLGKVGRQARLMLSADVDILRFAWRKGQNNFQVGAYAHADMQLLLDKETLAFVLQGPGAHVGENHLKNNRIDINAYAALYFGYARQINRNLTVGGRVKLLQGIANLHTRNLDITLDVQNSGLENYDEVPYQYSIRMDGDVLTNLPFNSDYTLGKLSFYPFRDIGLAFDLGFEYKIKNWTVAASANDLGFIFWADPKAGVYRSHMDNARFVYGGFPAGELDEDFNIIDYFKGVIRTALDSLDIYKDGGAGYARALPASFNVSLSYTLKDIHCFGLAFRGYFYNKFFAPEVIVSYTVNPTRNFGFSVSNNFNSSCMLNLGIAFVANAGPLQIHLGIDRINSFNVAAMRTVNLNLGFNLVFGKSRYDWFTGKSF